MIILVWKGMRCDDTMNLCVCDIEMVFLDSLSFSLGYCTSIYVRSDLGPVN